MRLRSLRPRYVLRRLGQIRFELEHPECPWLPRSTVLLLDNWLKPTDVGIEWGSGRSTVWLAERVAQLTSVEHDEAWYGRVQASLDVRGLRSKVDYRLVPCLLDEQAEPVSHPYAEVAREIADGTIDFALVDGNIRLTCVRLALSKLKPGGLLILDNANRFVPNPHLGGFSTVHEARGEPRSSGWAEVLARLGAWRWLSTTDGIWDTRLWISPAGAS